MLIQSRQDDYVEIDLATSARLPVLEDGELAAQ
jgi:hypothetical protein